MTMRCHAQPNGVEGKSSRKTRAGRRRIPAKPSRCSGSRNRRGNARRKASRDIPTMFDYYPCTSSTLDRREAGKIRDQAAPQRASG